MCSPKTGFDYLGFVMSNRRLLKILVLLVLAGWMYGCSSESSVERADRLLEQEQSNQQTTVSLEEIRGEEGLRTIGYLEKVELPSDTPSERRHMFYVYDESEEVMKGMILDNGMSYRRSGDDSLEQIGVTGVYDGVRTILSYNGQIQFYQNGRRISRGSN